MGLSEGRVELQGPDRSFLLFGTRFPPRQRASKAQYVEGLRNAGIGERVARIFGDGFPGIVETFPRTVRGQFAVPVATSQIRVLRFGIDGVNLHQQTALLGVSVMRICSATSWAISSCSASTS